MRILFIANKTDVFSGGQISLLELLRRLDRSRFDPFVLCPGEGELAEKVRHMDMKVEVLKMPTAKTINIKRLMRTKKALRSIIRQYDVDIVHTNGSRAQFYASLAVKHTRANLLWHVRESIKDIPVYDRFLARSANRIVCVSQAVKRSRFGGYPKLEPKIDVIYNGVDTLKFSRDERIRMSLRDELGIGDGKVLLGIVGLLVPLKGHPFLFESLRLLVEEYPDMRLLVLGKSIDERYAARLKHMTVEMGIQKNVIFGGARDDMKAVFSALDIFILPSQREGFSRVLLEAMACSLPIIATDVSGNSEAIVDGESGLLVPYGKVERLAEAIAHLVKDSRKAGRLGENARKRAEELFSIEKHVSRMQELYVSILKSVMRKGFGK